MLETFFSRFLEHMTIAAAQPLKVIYQRPSELGSDSTVVFSNTSEAAPILNLRVLSPAFYSRFVHYSHAAEAFDREYLCTDERNRTIWMDKPALLGPLLTSPSNQSGRFSKDQAMHKSGWLESLRWTLVRRLRCPPPAQSYGEVVSSSGESARSRMDIRARPVAAVDVFAAGQRDAWRYRRAVIELFTAQRLFGGVMAGPWLLRLLLRLGVGLAGWHKSCQWDATLIMTLTSMIASHVLAACTAIL